MLAGMMVTSNVLPAYSATDGIAVEQSDASYEAEAAAADASVDAENSEVGGVSSEQGDAGKPVADTADSDRTTAASSTAGDESHVAAAAAGSASSTSASNNAGAGNGVTDAAAGEHTTTNKSDAASGTAKEETKSDAANGTATEETKSDAANGTVTDESKADAANGTVTEESKSDAANGTVTEESKSDATHGTGVEESKADAVHGSNAGGSAVVGVGSVGIGESTGAAVEIEETKPAELLEEETKLATESEIPKEEDEKKLEEKENRKTIYIAFGKGVKVTATLEDANAVPDDARLRVSEIDDDEMYAAYLEAMDEAEPEIKHTKDNTDLRDIAFIMKDEDGEETEYEPTEGSVKVAIEYLGNNLKKRLGVDDIAEVKTYHLPLAEGVKAEGEKTIDVQNVKASDINVQKLDGEVKTKKKVEVELDSFSVTATVSETGETADYTTNSTPIDLTQIKSNITADATTTGELDRDAKISFDMTFAVDDYKLAHTVKTNGSDGKPVIHNVWVYDLSSFFDDKPLALVDQSEGALYDNGTKAGTYKVENNKVIFTIDPEFLYNRTTGIKGSFNFKAQVDSEKIGTKKEYEFTFTGVGTATKLTFKDVNTKTNKYCENGNGSVVVTPNEDGSATLTYHVSFNADASLTTLKMHDELSGEQRYDETSFEIAVGENWDKAWNSVPSDAINIDGKKADIDILKALGITSTKINTQYEVKYITTVKNEDIGKALSNSAHWTWDGEKKTEDKKVEITVHKTLNVTKNVTEDGGNYHYTITVGGPDIDMKGHTIKDMMSDNQVLVSAITIDPAVNGQSQITPSWTDDKVYSNSMTELFAYTFPEDKEYKGTYTITYSTKPADSKQLSGNQDVNNTVTDDHDGDHGQANTNQKHDFGKAEMASISKKWADWDLEGTEKALIWDIEVRLPDGVSSLHDVCVSEVESKYDVGSGAEWNRYKDMSIDLSAITVEDSKGNLLSKDTDYTVDNTKKEVHFSTLTKNVTIKGIRTVCPVNFTSGGQEYWFSNKAKVSVDGRPGDESEDKKRYVSSEWSMSKNVVHNEADDTYTWTVIINPEKAVFYTDRDLIFEDVIPDGMEMVGNLSIQTDGEDINHNRDFWGQPSPNVEGKTGTYRINITEEWKKQTYKNAPNGLSGVKYTLTYKTKLTNAAIENEKGKEDTFTYKNVARAQDGTNWKNTDCTVTRQYKFLEKKDLSLETIPDDKHDVIEYQIVINPDALTLNEGKDLALIDTIPEGTTLITDYSFNPDINSATVSLNSATRELKVIVPDQTKITFTYRLKSDDLHLGGHVFKNIATLTGKGTYTDYVEQNHIIKTHSATITGNATSINIHKYDEEALTKNLSGAVFKLYKLEVNNDGTISNTTTEAGESTTDANGKLTFTGLTPLNNDSSVYYAYKFVETQAPNGYEINEAYNAEHGYYFIFYTDAATKANEVKKLIEEKNTDIKVEVVSGAHTFEVSNKKLSTPVPEETSVEVSKTWVDAGHESERPEKITVNLLADGVKIQSHEVKASDGWTYKFTELNKYKEDGSEIVYTVTEEKVTNYTTEVNGYEIKNTYAPEKTSVEVSKTWVDAGHESERPEKITVNLLADGVKIQSHEVKASDGWTYKFTELNKYKKDGSEINYTVTEEVIPGYVLTDSSTSTEDGKTVVQLKNKSIDFTVNKFERTGTRELDGAKIQIKDSTGAVIAEWISKSGETHDFGSSLKAGETYTIHEETAPSGYYTISDVNFTVDEKGQITLAGSSDDVKLEDGVIKICDERIKSSGGGGGGDHPHPTPETTPAETTPAETTVPETTPVETTTPGGGNGGHHDPSEEVETDEFGNVLGANRGRNKNGQDGGNVKGANRGKTRTGDESMMSIFGFGFLAAVLVLLGWFGIRFTKRNRR